MRMRRRFGNTSSFWRGTLDTRRACKDMTRSWDIMSTVPPLDLSLLSELSEDTDLVSPTQVTTWMRSWRPWYPSSFWCGVVVGGLTVLVTQRVSRLIRNTA